METENLNFIMAAIQILYIDICIYVTYLYACVLTVPDLIFTVCDIGTHIVIIFIITISVEHNM